MPYALSCLNERRTLPDNSESEMISGRVMKMSYLKMLKKRVDREFPGGPVVRTRCFHRGSLGSIPGQGAKILQAA